MVPINIEEKMDGGEGIFLMEKKEWMDCFPFTPSLGYFSNTYFAASIYAQWKRTRKNREWKDC